MIRVELSFVPPGGGEVQYSLPMNMPALPREGDYVSIERQKVSGEAQDSDDVGFEDFIVRQVRWQGKYPDDGQAYYEAGKEPVGECEVVVVCEFALSMFSSEAHKRAVQNFSQRGKGDPRSF